MSNGSRWNMQRLPVCLLKSSPLPNDHMIMARPQVNHGDSYPGANGSTMSHGILWVNHGSYMGLIMGQPSSVWVLYVGQPYVMHWSYWSIMGHIWVYTGYTLVIWVKHGPFKGRIGHIRVLHVPYGSNMCHICVIYGSYIGHIWVIYGL